MIVSLLLFIVLRKVGPAPVALQSENLALRQQLAVLKRNKAGPRLRPPDRLFWMHLSRHWPAWRDALVIVKPATVVAWHRRGFRLFWTWKSGRRRAGRPRVLNATRELIGRMCRENPLWGAPRLHGEQLKLGIEISKASVSRYMARHSRPPSQKWRTFLDNHVDGLASIDLFVVPTATFSLLYAFVILHHQRCWIVHFGVTPNPTAAWVAQQITEAFPWDTVPRHLIRDRDAEYGALVRGRLRTMGIEEAVTAPSSPWPNSFAERVIGSLRRDCLDHVIMLNERHLRRLLSSYVDYCHRSRTHLALDKDAPDGRSSGPEMAGSWRTPNSAGCIIATNGSQPEWRFLTSSPVRDSLAIRHVRYQAVSSSDQLSDGRPRAPRWFDIAHRRNLSQRRLSATGLPGGASAK